MKKLTSHHTNLIKIAAVKIVYLTILLLSHHAQGQHVAPFDHMMATHISLAEGLPHNYVDHIYRDTKGFIWISTGAGLVRYDGYEFIRYAPSSDINQIAGNYVKTTAEDPFQRLWVATDNGLSVIDLRTLRTITPTTIDPYFKTFSLKNLSSVTVDSKGHLWIARDETLHCITFSNDGKIERTDSLTATDKRATNPGIVSDIYADGNVWTEISGEIRVLTPSAKGLTTKTINVKLPMGAIVNDMTQHRGKVWIATDRGLVSYDPADQSTTLYLHSPSDPTTISQDLVTALTVSPEGHLLAATLNGINVYNDATNTFDHETTTDTGAMLNSNFINCMLSDNDKLWIGTETGGINLFTTKELRSDFDRHYPNDPTTLASGPVNALYEDAYGTLYVGVVEGGLNCRKKGSNAYEHYTTSNSALSHNSVSAITQDGDCHLWVGTWGGGIDVVDPNNPHTHYMRLLEFGEFGTRPYIGSLYWDDLNKGMWIGTSHGIFFYDTTTGKIIEPFKGATSARGCIGAATDTDNKLWLGTMQGLYEIDLLSRKGDTWQARTLLEKLDAPGSRLREKITYVFCDSQGTLWVASDVHGVYRRQKNAERDKEFQNITTTAGLSQHVAISISEDYKHRIWVATNKGLSCYLPEDDHFVNYTTSQGLQCDQFYWNAAMPSRSGRLYFGTIDGLMSFAPGDITTDTQGYKVAFTRLYVDNEIAGGTPYLDDQDISIADHITLHERNRSFSIEFTALDFTRHPDMHYCYKLEGFDDDWVTLPEKRNFVSYTNLSPGQYRLLVKYQPEGHHDEVPISTIDITIERYFYHTLWFGMLMIIIALSILTTYLLWRKKRVQAREAELEKAVAERTQEISKQKQMLEERTMRIQELTVDRLSFFTNLTHEFRTPITLILGPVKRALQICTDSNVAQQLTYVERNAKYLLNLVNQLMDFRKIESGKLEIVRKKSNFIEFIDELEDTFAEAAAQRGITLEKHLHLTTPEICFDRENVRKLLTNLIGNAIKYTPDGGKITVMGTLLPEACTQTGTSHLYLCVSDTGDGIAPEDIDKVFDRFYQGKTYVKYPLMQASSGIGLHLCKSIVETYGGHISVKNNPVHGCRFRIVLPVPALADESSTASTAHPADAPQSDSRIHSNLKVMIIEDNADMRGYIRSVLADKYTLLEATNGEEALKKLASEDVDFIICDMMMPVMDGVQFAKVAKDNFSTSHIPIIMLTARTADEAKLESFAAGVDDYISKPFSEEILVARIENIMSNKKRHQRKFDVDYDTSALEIDADKDKKFLDQVMEVLRSNYKNSYFDMGDFSEALGVSRSVLNKKLQSLVGQSSNEFVRNYRLSVARKMIEKLQGTKAMNISEIAYDVGFNDSKYFTRCFTKLYGITPSSLLSGNK